MHHFGECQPPLFTYKQRFIFFLSLEEGFSIENKQFHTKNVSLWKKGLKKRAGTKSFHYCEKYFKTT